jgi:hypothetical protein
LRSRPRAVPTPLPLASLLHDGMLALIAAGQGRSRPCGDPSAPRATLVVEAHRLSQRWFARALPSPDFAGAARQAGRADPCPVVRR